VNADAKITGGDLLWLTLQRLGIDTVFGLPGTQTVGLYETLRQSRMRHVLTTHELAAAFAANGYYRATGRPAAVTTIPGPGFTFALTGLAEARHDSAALVYITINKAVDPHRRFQFQVLDQETMVRGIVKMVTSIASVDELVECLSSACHTAVDGEPGPVMVQIAPGVLSATTTDRATEPADTTESNRRADELAVSVAAVLAEARRPMLLFGQGAQSGSESARQVALQLGCPVLTTTSGRGIISEDSPQVAAVDYGLGGVEAVNEMITDCDLVLAVGCKFSHNGSAGFRLRIPPEKLLQIDASPEVLGANYPARLTGEADAAAFLAALAARLPRQRSASDWPNPTASECRAKTDSRLIERLGSLPVVDASGSPTLGEFFAALRKSLPDDAILVTDSGLHQMATRAFYRVRSPRGLVTPTDFQSMGFGVPAAVGAALAAERRPVVLVVGDGGLAMMGMELLTAVRQKLALTVIVFSDRSLGLIRKQQDEFFGTPFGVDLDNPDWSQWASAIGAAYSELESPFVDSLQATVGGKGVTLLELPLKDPLDRRVRRAARQAVAGARKAVGAKNVALVKRLLGKK